MLQLADRPLNAFPSASLETAVKVRDWPAEIVGLDGLIETLATGAGG
jgi:hypothetical protein